MEKHFKKAPDQVIREQLDFQNLRNAVMERNEPELKRLLSVNQLYFFPYEAYELCSLMVRHQCSLELFQCLLEYCVPLEEFVLYGASLNHIPGHTGGTGGLAQEAAYWDNAPVLEFLLDQGYSPNPGQEREYSALEAALWGASPHALQLLVQREDVDFSITERILDIWGTLGMDENQDACFRMAAGCLLGNHPTDRAEELPLLPGLTVLHAAHRENWELLDRICREGTVTVAQGTYVLNHFMHHSTQLVPMRCAKLLDALFTACPGLLRCEYPRYLLVLCLLSGGGCTRGILDRWVE